MFIFIKTANIQEYKNKIIAKISSKLGRDVGVGNVELNFSIDKGLGVNIQDFFIGDHPNFSPSPLLAVDSIHLSLDIRKLIFEWRLFVSKIEVKRPRINIIRNKEGKINFQELLKKNSDNENPEKIPVLPPERKRTDLEAYIPFIVQSSEATEEADSSFNMFIKFFRIVDGTITITDHKDSFPIVLPIEKIYFQTSNLSLEKRFPFRLDCSLLSSKKNIHLEGQMRLSIHDGIVTQYQFDKIGLDSMDVFQKLIKNGWAKEKGLTQIQVTADLDKERNQMVKIFDRDFSKILPILQQSRNQQVRLDNFFVRTDLSNLSIEKVLKAFPPLRFLGIENSLKGKIYLDGDKFITDKQGLQLLLTGHLIDAEVKLASLAYPIENIDLDFTMTESDVTLSELFMYLASGKIHGRLKLENYLRKQKFSFNVDVEDVHLDEIVPEGTLPVKVTGRLYGKLIGKGLGLSKSQLKEAATADIVMEVKEGELGDINILRTVLDGISIIPHLVEDIESNLPDKYKKSLYIKGTKLEKVNVDAALSKGILSFKQAEVGADGFLVSARGQIDWKQNLDLEANIFIAQDLSSSMVAALEELSGFLDDQQQIRIPLRGYHGKLENFIMYPDLENLGKKIIRNRGKEELKKVLFKALDIEETQPPAQQGEATDQQDSKSQQPSQKSRPEGVLIDTIFDAIFR